MKLSIGDAFGLSAAALDEEIVKEEKPTIVDKTIAAIKDLFCVQKDDKKKRD